MEQKRKWMLELKRLIVESLAARVPMRVSCAVALPIQLWSSLVCKFPEEHGKCFYWWFKKCPQNTPRACFIFHFYEKKCRIHLRVCFTLAAPLHLCRDRFHGEVRSLCSFVYALVRAFPGGTQLW